MSQKQVKSKQRVADHGEVFTAEREVNAMLDLVGNMFEQDETKTFLEPACGDGNFLAEILRRKLSLVRSKYKPQFGSCADYELHAVKAVMSIYGVELLEDNTKACRERLFKIWDDEYTAVCKDEASDDTREVVRFILERNILNGDALTLLQSDGEPIIFSEWTFPDNSFNVKRRDFRLDVLMSENPDEENYMQEAQLSLFGDAPNSIDFWEEDPDTHEKIPKPVKTFELCHYKSIKEQ